MASDGRPGGRERSRMRQFLQRISYITIFRALSCSIDGQRARAQTMVICGALDSEQSWSLWDKWREV